MALGSPCLVGTDLLPADVSGIIAGLRQRPRWIVAKVELPWTIERRDSLAQPVNCEHRSDRLRSGQ